MIIKKQEEHGVVILKPNGRLDSNTSPVLEDQIDEINSNAAESHLLVDFMNIDYISSAGLRVILKAYKQRKEQTKSFAVCGMQDHVKEVFEISGFDSYISIFPDMKQALDSFDE